MFVVEKGSLEVVIDDEVLLCATPTSTSRHI